MRVSLSILLLLLTACCFAQSHKLEKLWQTDTIIAVPESVLPDLKNNRLFISLIDGGGWVADGKGGVGLLSADGKSWDGNWISGLNAPKGMGIANGKLYVADMGEVVIIDIAKGVIEKKIVPDSAKGLNDIAVTDEGIVFISDSRTGRIWKLEGEKPVLFLDTVRGVNGLKAIGHDLYIGAGKSFVKADAQGKLTKIADLPQGIDGIEPVGNGDFILTAWAGYIFYVDANGKVETLLETHAEKKNTADIGYDGKNRIVYVPTFNGKTVVAYKLN
jgi:hypothetical protein